jgi:hypothetical protein
MRNLFSFLIFLSLTTVVSCSQTTVRGPSSQGLNSSARAKSELTFMAFHTFSPTRRSGGEWVELNFQPAKSISELSFEYLNYRVRIHQVEIITESGHTLPIPVLSAKELTGQNPFLIFDGLNASLRLTGVRMRVEGYEHDDVALTVSFFSPDGFLKSELSQFSSRPMKQENEVLTSLTPQCHQRDRELRRYQFNFEEIQHASASRHFCEHFVPAFKSYLQTHPAEAEFLRVGLRGSRPLIVVSNRFHFDEEYNEILVPLQFNRSQLAKFHQLVVSSRQSARRERDEDSQRNIALDMDYDTFMNEGMATSRLTYAEEYSIEGGGMTLDYCQKTYSGHGVPAGTALRYCQQVIGFEREHFACFEQLLDHHFPISSAHSSCVEAQGKWMSYLSCAAELSELNFSHHDTHYFCVRTPDAYMTAQRQCVRELKARKISSFHTLRSCSRAWGNEESLLTCLDQRGPASHIDRLKQCLP